jgi:hypothetical protein
MTPFLTVELLVLSYFVTGMLGHGLMYASLSATRAGTSTEQDFADARRFAYSGWFGLIAALVLSQGGRYGLKF